MIKFENVRKQYEDGFVALKNINLDIQKGELFTLIGPSGCGKTTTMKMINRLIEPTEGKIYIEVMAGIRTATVLTIGVAALATFIGAGGLGDLIDRGLRVADKNLIITGSIPAAILAILFDLALRKLEKKVTPRGLKS
jgi:ABC-type proline/glycine betaine transport system permease subunit